MSVIPMVAFFVMIAFISGGLGLAAIFGYIAGYLLLFDHLILAWEGYEGYMMLTYGPQIYAGIFFNLIIFLFLPTVPIMARGLAKSAARQITKNQQSQNSTLYLFIFFVTQFLMVTLLMMAWNQMVLLGSFSYYLWWDRGYGVWDFEQFLKADLWGLHPLIWAAWAGMAVRILLDILFPTMPGKNIFPLDLPPPFAFYKKIPLTLKSVLAALFLFLILQGYIADTPSLWGYLIAGLLLLFVARDGIEVWLHRWFGMIERVPLAYRLMAIFMVMGFLVHHLTEYLADNFFTRTPEPHIIVLAITICLPVAFLLVSKNEPHRNNPPPNAPFWLKPFLTLLKKIKVPQAVRKRLTKAAPVILLFALLGLTTSAFAHHCFHGCDSCDYFTWFFNYIAGGMAGLVGGVFGGGSSETSAEKEKVTPKNVISEVPPGLTGSGGEGTKTFVLAILTSPIVKGAIDAIDYATGGPYKKKAVKGAIDIIKGFFKKSPYQIAKEGGKHKKWYQIYTAKTDREIRKGIRSIEKEISEHKAKIKNPKKYIKDFDKLDKRHQKDLIENRWPKDIQRQKEQKDILEGILKERKSNG